MKQFNLCIIIFILLMSSWAQGSQGHVDVLVSKDGMPLENFNIKIDGKPLKTDEIGFVTTKVQAGMVHKLSFIDNKKSKEISFDVVENERTQLLVNILGDSMLHDVIEPEKVSQKAFEEGVQETGTLSLVVKSINGSPVSNARIFVKGTGITERTNSKGMAQIKVPVGEVTISLSHQKFSTQIERKIKIEKNQSTTKNVALTPTGLVLEDFVVLAPSMKGSIEALIEVRRKSSNLADVMSAEQMAKTGDSDAAGSLRRVTGLTLKDGKFVYVRGLGERYSATLLNGVALPSPDPSRRVIPLDLFPVQFLDSMVIQKSYSPDMPGEFGGGTVMLKTKSIPDKFFLKTSFSQTHNSNVSTVNSYQSSPTDWYGVDNGGRQLPEDVINGGDISQLFQGTTRHRITEDSEGRGAETLPEFSFSLGDGWGGNKFKLGYTFSGLYKDNLDFVDEQRGRFIENGGQLVNDENYTRSKATKERVIGGILGVSTQIMKDHKINVNYIGIRNTTDYVAVLEGQDQEDNTIRQTEREFAARILKTVLVQGESHLKEFNNTKFTTYFSSSRARRDEPSRILDIYSPDDKGTYVFNLNDNTTYQRRYYDLQENVQDLGLTTSTAFPWFSGRKGQVSAGFSQMAKNRESTMRRFGFDGNNQQCPFDMSQDLDQIFANCRDFINPRNVTQPTDNYNATQDLQSYHFTTKWPLLSSVTLNTGMRYEESTQRVNTISPLENSFILSELRTFNWLPGNSLTWKLNKKMQIRLAQSETISRPDLRELSNTVWQDFDLGYDVTGNPNLRATVIKNYDARWEWYFRRKENVSFGFFYKEFDQPIEQYFTNQNDPTIGFLNAQTAEIYGAEVEFSKNLASVARWLSAFTVSGNYAYIVSAVDLGDVSAVSASDETGRPLQGQSEFTANLLLDYESKKMGMNASLAYNVYGKRIAFIAPDGLPNVWEMPFHQVDFVFRKKVSKTLSVNGKIRNLLDPEVRFRQGDRLFQGLRRGQSYTLGLSMEI